MEASRSLGTVGAMKMGWKTVVSALAVLLAAGVFVQLGLGAQSPSPSIAAEASVGSDDRVDTPASTADPAGDPGRKQRDRANRRDDRRDDADDQEQVQPVSPQPQPVNPFPQPPVDDDGPGDDDGGDDSDDGGGDD